MSRLTILGGGEVDQRYATCYVYVFMFFESVQAFFTLDRFGQQADRNIAPGGMFFYVFKVSRADYVNRVIKGTIQLSGCLLCQNTNTINHTLI